MQFTKQSIMEADLELLSEQEKKHLLDKYFPEDSPKWKEDLSIAFEEIQRQKVWASYQGESTFGDFGEEYRFTKEHLTNISALYKNLGTPSLRGNRVTDFSKWVMSLYMNNPIKQSALSHGKYVEKSVARLARPLADKNWELIYRDPLNAKPVPLKISALTVNGDPIWGAPDVVYRNIETGEIIIVERKASDKVIPINGWPNLRAQLWAYGHIDIFKTSPKITLVGEVWNFEQSKSVRRAVMRWQLKDSEFYNENAELFALYGGASRA